MGALLAGGLPGLLNQSSAQVIDGSLKFDKTSVHFLEKTFSSAGNRKTWTWSGWFKRGAIPSSNNLWTAYNGSYSGLDNFGQIYTDAADGRIVLYQGGGAQYTSSARFRDHSGWYHIVISCDVTQSTYADRFKIYVNGVLNTSSSGTIAQNTDLAFNNNIKHYIGTSNGSAELLDGKMSQVYFIGGLALGPGYFGFTDPLTNTWRPRKFRAEGTTVNDGTVWSSTTGDFTNPTNVFNGNTTDQGYANNTGTTTITTGKFEIKSNLRLYNNFRSDGTYNIIINGVSINVPGEGTNSATYRVSEVDLSSLSLPITVTSLQYYISQASGNSLRAIEVDGVIMQDSTTTNLDFGTNGFYLPMDGNSPIGEDKSGQGNNWTAVNFSGTSIDPDVLKDSPSGAVSGGRAQTGITTTSSAPSNYATMNPLQMSPNRTPTISDGNLSISLSSGSSEWTNTGCTMNIGSGKYYWEVQFTTINGTIARIGVADSNNYEFNRNTASSGLPWLGSGTGVSWSLDVGGNTYYNGSTVNASYTSTIITSDIIGVLLDLDNNTLSFSKNGTNLGVAHSNVTSDFVTPGFGLHGGTTNTINVNFGQKPFKYAPPQGFLPLNSASATPETVITHPNQYFGTTIWTGNGGTGLRTIPADFKFKPDFVWDKVRTGTDSHILYDSVRGYGASKALKSNSNVAQGENDNATYGYVNNTSNGSIEIFGGSSAASDSFTNENNQNMVAWCWKAGGNKGNFNVDDVGYENAADAGFATGGSNITPTGASVGTKQGFSIVKWDVGSLNGTLSLDTGLTKAPDFVITKVTNHADDWLTFHKDLSSTESLIFNGTRGATSNAAYAHTFNSNGTISGLVVPNWWIANKSYVFYSWHDVPGLQKFGKFIGNASADGNFIELGFRPALVWIKPLYDYNGGSSIIAQTGWYIYDNKRETFNPNGKVLAANREYVEEDNSTDVDFLSNGFKLRNTRAVNTSSGAIYCAWAEAPTFNLYGGQSNAR